MTPILDRLHVVVAVKGNGDGKRRLAGVLTPDERQHLVVTMLEDVLAAVAATAGIGQVSVLTRETAIVPHDFRAIDDPGFGLNPAIVHAANLLTLAGRRAMLVLPADLPFVSPADIRALMDAATERSVVIAPDVSGTGTNALLLSPPNALRPRFGARSCGAHVESARAAGIDTHVLNRPGLARDIDEPADLHMLVRDGGSRYAFLTHALRKAS